MTIAQNCTGVRGDMPTLAFFVRQLSPGKGSRRSYLLILLFVASTFAFADHITSTSILLIESPTSLQQIHRTDGSNDVTCMLSCVQWHVLCLAFRLADDGTCEMYVPAKSNATHVLRDFHLLQVTFKNNKKMWAKLRRRPAEPKQQVLVTADGAFHLDELPSSCEELNAGGMSSYEGVQTVFVGGLPVSVSCDASTLGGNWTIFQRRQDGSVDFYRGWSDYRRGFGDAAGEFWLGLDALHAMTAARPTELRVDLWDFAGGHAYAQYDTFAVDGEKDFYKLTARNYVGTAGTSMNYHHGKRFSTRDADHDWSSSVNCAVKSSGAWWYGACHNTNLNGLYLWGDNQTTKANGVNWESMRGDYYSLRKTEMKFRRKY